MSNTNPQTDCIYCGKPLKQSFGSLMTHKCKVKPVDAQGETPKNSVSRSESPNIDPKIGSYAQRDDLIRHLEQFAENYTLAKRDESLERMIYWLDQTRLVWEAEISKQRDTAYIKGWESSERVTREHAQQEIIDEIDGLVELAERPNGTTDLETLGQNVEKYLNERTPQSPEKSEGADA